MPLAVEVTPGQQHESTCFETVLRAVRIGRRWYRPATVAGDKGYSMPRIRDWLHRHALRAVIPQKANERPLPGPLDQQTYRRRSVIEPCVGWLKECRRVATRFEKYAVNFASMVKLAIIERYLQNELPDTA